MSALPHEIGRHVVLDVVREGGAVEILRAYDRERRHEVVLVLRDEPVADPQALAKLSHPCLAAVHEIGVHDGRSFVALEAIVGATFAEWSTRPRPWRDVLAICVAAGEGLAAAHAVGIVHGDLSAASVILEKSGRVRVTGLCTRDATKADDVAALAAIAWEAIYGKPPFAAPDSRELARVDEQRAPPWVYVALRRVLKAAPNERGELSTLLDELRRDAVRTKQLRVAGAVFAIGATVASVFAIRSWIERERVVACEEDGALIDTLWNDSARGDLETSIAHSGVADPQAIAARATASLDDFASRWSEARAGVCIGREIDHVVDPDAYAGAMSCLESRHLALEALLAELTRPDERTAARAPDAAASLPSPTDCGSAGHRGAPHPDDLPVEPVRSVRTSLARASALLALGKVHEARELASSTLDEALVLEWRPLVADARLQLCVAAKADGDPAHAYAACEAAYFEAAQDRRTGVMGDAAILLVELVGAQLGREAEARHWGLHAETALALANDADDRRLARLRSARATMQR